MPSVRRWVVSGSLLSILGCAHVDVAAERDAILATDKPWQEAIAAKDVDRAVSFWADDAVVMAPGGASLTGKNAIRGFVAEAFKMPGFGLMWETTSVNVASQGDLAYALARTTTTVNGPDGKPTALRGKAATVWRKGADGRWRCVVDIWNDEAPPRP
jgi:uncharacterized protein (TIGR02246 family)